MARRPHVHQWRLEGQGVGAWGVCTCRARRFFTGGLAEDQPFYPAKPAGGKAHTPSGYSRYWNGRTPPKETR